MRQSSFSHRRINAEKFSGIERSLDENLLAFKYSPLAYNFTFSKGIIRDTLGIENVTLTTLNSTTLKHTLPDLPSGVNVKSVHLYKKYDFINSKRDDKLMIRTTDDEFYYISVFETDEYHLIPNLVAYGKCCTENYRYNGNDLFLLASETGRFFTYDGTTVTEVATAPNMTSMCIHAERVFATISGEQNRVWFSSEFNPHNWVVSGTGAGYIDFDDDGGRVIKVKKFLNYIYVFRDYGIERLTAYGSQSDFSLSKIYMSSSKIYPDTIVDVGDYIYFLTDDGIFALDGYNVKKVSRSICDFLPYDKKDAIATGLSNKYYLGIKLDFGSDNANKIHDEVNGCTNNCIVEFDANTSSMSIMRGIDVRHMLSLKVHHESSLILCFRGDNSGKLGKLSSRGKYFSVNLKKYWTTGYTDLGYPDRKKALRDISLITTCDIVLGVELDGTISEFNITGGTLPKKVIINRPFTRMRIFIKSEAFAITGINAPTVTADIQNYG